MRQRLTVTVHPRVAEHIKTLLGTGLFGRSQAAVIDGLICRALQRVAADGWIETQRILEERGEIKIGGEPLEPEPIHSSCPGCEECDPDYVEIGGGVCNLCEIEYSEVLIGRQCSKPDAHDVQCPGEIVANDAETDEPGVEL